MENDERISNNPVDGNAGIKKNEQKIRKEGASKGVLVTAIIGFIILLIAVAIAHSLYKRIIMSNSV
jgi:hypothetical protein